MSECRHSVKVDINDNCFDIIRLVHGIAYFVRGVPVFFFLSGMFIARSLEYYKTGEFLKRRILRIFPELWVCVVFNLILVLFSLERGGYGPKDILLYLLTQMTAFSILYRRLAERIWCRCTKRCFMDNNG